MPLYHVMFDGKPQVQCHVCAEHKAIADTLECDDERGPDGECAHVQYGACNCAAPEACVGCDDQVHIGTQDCHHTARVRPVVWRVTPDGEVPNAVVCEQCWRTVSANGVAYAAYDEDEDGWYVPDKTRGEAPV
jgi:hypothetical protein